MNSLEYVWKEGGGREGGRRGEGRREGGVGAATARTVSSVFMCVIAGSITPHPINPLTPLSANKLMYV